MSERELRNILEAALLASGKSLSVGELGQLFEEGRRPPPSRLRAELEALNEEYADRALEVRETATGFRVQVRAQYAGAVARLWPDRPQRYSRALLETLALIAYRQPITRAEIEAVRGVAVNPAIIKALQDRGWVNVVGHREVPGRPELLGTTGHFLEYFGLRRLEELPPLAELRSLGEIEPQLQLEVVGASNEGMPAEALAAADVAAAETPADSAMPVAAPDSEPAVPGAAHGDG